MSRLTRKTNGKDYCLYCDCIEIENAIFVKSQELLSPEKYYKEEPYKMEDGYYYEDAMKRLGKIEDLMDEYNINSIEELENVLSSKFIAGWFRSSGKTIVAKGMLYNELSEELGCPLEVVFKALKDGINVICFDEEIHFHNSPSLNKYDEFYFSETYYPYGDSCCDATDDSYQVKLSDYKKTWWLKGEKERCTFLN